MIDVCLILEGSYPYVAGGVSTWVHQLVSSMSHIRFGLVCIAPHSDPTRSMKYSLPHNVLSITNLYLHDYDFAASSRRRERSDDTELIREFYCDLFKSRYTRFHDFVGLFRGSNACYDLPGFFTSRRIWDLLIEFYERYAPDVSLLDFFWTWRGLHLPLVQVLKTDIPKAKIYHAISTGYAGLLGAIARIEHGGHFFITEHGIYTVERMLEISQANWIYEQNKMHYRADRELPFFKQWWIAMFQVMSRIAYQYVDRIFTLYEGNRVREMMEGAPAEKIQIIPNGIDLKLLGGIVREKRVQPQIALIGRVVSIKDIRTFIYAAQVVLRQLSDLGMPEADFYIIGPTDEEEDYFQECCDLVHALGLEERVRFTGMVDLKDYLQFLDLVVLTSLSEAQPYVLLEANVAGIPVVSSNVGACSEMINGREKMDMLLGPSGLVTEVSNPQDTARAILRLLRDQDFYQQCAEAGRKRVRDYYDQDDLLSRYLNIYEQSL